MSRRLIAAAAVACAALAAPAARADSAGAVGARAGVDDEHELGARIGLRMGGGTTPGGLGVAVVYLYRLADDVWSESVFDMAVGGGGAACFRDRGDAVRCDHGQLDGFGVGGHTGLRWTLPGKQGFEPFLRGTVGVELVRFGADDLTGIAVPVVVGGGVRAQVAPRVAVGAQADLHAGIARMGRGMSGEPHLALAVVLGVDFVL
ncbi:MAG: hypothetical protein D6689_04645 [Deltaproteobacteria bacterium]|nr:MAG: hypothetical protein D6689_04645 [Deltaproteobacteria bacterium]